MVCEGALCGALTIRGGSERQASTLVGSFSACACKGGWNWEGSGWLSGLDRHSALLCVRAGLAAASSGGRVTHRPAPTAEECASRLALPWARCILRVRASVAFNALAG